MALKFKDGITTDETGKVVGVGDKTGSVSGPANAAGASLASAVQSMGTNTNTNLTPKGPYDISGKAFGEVAKGPSTPTRAVGTGAGGLVSEQDLANAGYQVAGKELADAVDGGAGSGTGDGTGNDMNDPSSYLGDQYNQFGMNITGPKQIVAPTFEAEKARLAAARDSRIAALDVSYASNLATVQKNNKNVSNSLKARLIKLGVKPSDSAWSNAEAGQLERDTASEAKLQAEYQSNKAKIEADSDEQITNIAMTEAKMGFDSQVQNIQNKLTTQAQGIDLFQIFSNRDQSEKDREQDASQHLDEMDYKFTSLDQAQQESVSKTIMDNAQKGMYNISDKNTLAMLAKMEKESPYLRGVTNVASAGLADRLDAKAMDALNRKKIESDIAQNYAQINKLKADAASGGSSGSNSKELQAFYDDAGKQLSALAGGKTDWNTAYNTMMTKYKPVDAEGAKAQSELVDSLLNKAVWSQTGAYEKISSGRKTTDPNSALLAEIAANTQGQ